MELPRVFPIFPLESAVLVPGALLPLHIFEPRYCDMVRDTIAGHGMLAMAMPLLGHGASLDGSPPVHPVVGLGRIVRHQELPDGRWSIVLEGVARMRIDQELPPEQSYRRVHADPLPDDAPEDAAALHSSLTGLLDRLPELDESVRDALLNLDVGTTLDIVLMRLPIAAREKHRIHAETSPELRVGALRRIVDVLAGRHPGVDVEAGDPRLN